MSSTSDRLIPLNPQPLKYSLLLGSLIICIASTQFILLPWVAKISATAHCAQVFGMNGLEFLLLSIFVVGPFLMLICSIWAYFNGRSVLSSGQYPAPGSLVFRNTQPLTGKAARIRGYIMVSMPFLMLILMAASTSIYMSKRNSMVDDQRHLFPSVCRSKSQDGA